MAPGSTVAPLLLLLSAISPLPLIIQRLRVGLGSASMGACLAVALIATFSPRGAAFFALFLAVPGLLIGQATARGRGLLRGCGWAFALLALEIGTALLFAGPQLGALAVEPFEQSRSAEYLSMLRSSGWREWTQDEIDAWVEQTRTLQSAMEVVYPAVFIICGALVVLVNAALLRTYLARRDPGWLDGGEFERIRWPLGLAVCFVLAGASVAMPPLRPAGYNALLVVAFFFALQGLAVVAYYAHRLAGPPLLRTGLMILVLLNPWAPQILALLGLFDTWLDFRKWAEPPEAEEG